MTLRIKLGLAVVAAAAVASMLFFAIVAKANPFDLITSNVTATTTVAYMTPGTATTTYYYDSYATNLGDPNATDKAVMLVQLIASSTSTRLVWNYEYAQGSPGVDCVATPTVCDWYADNYQVPTNATTTGISTYSTSNGGSWLFASTSQGGAIVESTNQRGLKTLLVPTPARYVRVFFSLAPGSTRGAVWASFITQKQQPE